METVRKAAPPVADATRAYKPLSALAVSALILSILTALVLAGFGAAAIASHRPFLSWFVLLMAIVAIGLSIAAKLQLAYAEGTRAGAKAASFALLLSLVIGLGYAAYWFAIDFAIRKQSQEAAEQWIQYLLAADTERAFRLTCPPAQQRSMGDDLKMIRSRFIQEVSLFERSNVPRLLRTWPGKIDYTFEGIHNWEMTPAGFEVELIYLLRCPEGTFRTRITALGSDDPDTGERGWQVVFNKTGYREEEIQRTTLGKLVWELQYESHRKLPDWLQAFQAAGAKAAAPFIRVEGEMPPADKRDKIAQELMESTAITVYPGGPTRPLGYASIVVNDQGVFVISFIQVNAPTVGQEITTNLTRRVRGDALVKEMQRLAGSDWRNQPINTDTKPELTPFDRTYETYEINLRPASPKIGLRQTVETVVPTPKMGDNNK